MTQKRPHFGPRRRPLAAILPWLGRLWRWGWRAAVAVAVVYGLFVVSQLDVSRLAPQSAPKTPVGEGANLMVYDDGQLFLRATAAVVQVEENNDLIQAQGITDGELFDEKGRRRVRFEADTLRWRKSEGQVAMEGGVTLSASEGDVITAPLVVMNRTERKVYFHEGIDWRAGRNHLSAGVAQADGKLRQFTLGAKVAGEIYDLHSLALSRSQRTFKKRGLSPREVLPVRVNAQEAVVDQTAGLATFTSALPAPPLLVSLQKNRLYARTARVFTREKRLEVEGGVQLIRPGQRQKRLSDAANAFAQDKAVIATVAFTWFYGEKRMVFPSTLSLVQPARQVTAGQGLLNDAADLMDLTAGVTYQQTKGPWAARLKDFDRMEKDARDVLTSPMSLKTSSLHYNLRDGGFEATGGVDVKVKERTLTGHRAIYRPAEKLWRVMGAVAFRQKDKQAVFTELFTFHTEQQRAQLTGRARVLLNPSERMVNAYDDMEKDPLWR